MPTTRRPPLWLPFLAGLLLYLSTLSLPLIYDTLLHFRIASALDWRSVWLPTEAFGFYRPLTFVPFLLIEQFDLLDRAPVVLHGLNLLQHGVNGSLVAWLAWRLWDDRWRALLAGLLFVSFPFSYQAVAVFGHNVHPQAVLILLLGLHSYLNGIAAARPIGWWLATVFWFVLGLLNHESGILFGLIAGLTHMAYVKLEWAPLQTDFWGVMRRHAPAIVLSVLGGVYFIGYQFLPLTRAPQAEAAVSGTKWLYVMQAYAYPLTFFGRILPQSIPAAWITLPAFALTVAALLLATRSRFHFPPKHLILVHWWFLASFLLVVPLSADYLLHGPRLLYLSSVGIALVWATILTALPRPATLLLGVALLTASVTFISGRLDAYRQITGVTDALIEGTSADQPLQIINLPAWQTPAQPTFRVGVEIVQQLGSHLFASELLHYNGGAAQAVSVELAAQQTASNDFQAGYHQDGSFEPLSQATQLALVTEADGAFKLNISFIDKTDDIPLATFDRIQLVDVAAYSCFDETTVALGWRWLADELPSPTLSVFVHLVGANGLISQADSGPAGLPFAAFELDESNALYEFRVLAHAAGASDTVHIGVYDFATGDRLAATAVDGQPPVNNAFVIPIDTTLTCHLP